MYSVVIDETIIIHSPYVDNLKIIEPKIVKAINQIDSFDFSIYPNHSAYNLLKHLTTRIEVINEINGKTVFKGRVFEPRTIMSGNGEVFKEIVCEGELGYLHDSKQRWKKYASVTVESFMRSVIEQHNKQVESFKQFTVGKIDVSSEKSDLYTDEEATTYETLFDLIDKYDGEIQIRYENGIKYIDYLKQVGEKGNQRIELSVNLQSITHEIDPSDVITILKPLGQAYEYEDGNDDATNPRLTIESVNNGSVYLRDEAKIAQFGVKISTEVWDDIVSAAELKSKGTEFLSNQKTILEKFQVEAVDLAPLKLDVDFFQIGWTYDVYNPLMGIDEELRVVGINIDVNDPTESSMSIGDKILTQEEYTQKIRKQVASTDQLKKVVQQQSKRIVTIQQTLAETESNLVDLQNAVNFGSTEVQNQIAALIAELQTVVSEMQNIAATIPSSETIAAIKSDIQTLNGFMENQKNVNLNQTSINTDVETRIRALENNTGGAN